MSNQDAVISKTELRAACDFALDAARAAGELTLSYFRTELQIHEKADGSAVTAADREAEKLLRARIAESYPDFSVLGEEFGSEPHDSPFRWIVDPIDGTKSFISGVPLYTVLIALCHEDEPLLGVIHSPATGETVSAYRGGGCRYNGNAVRLRPCASLDGALVLTTDFINLARRYPSFSAVLYQSEASGRTWADGYGYLMLASGRADAMIDPIVSPWDVAAVKPILTEAGARCSDMSGIETGLGESVIAAGPTLHRTLIQLAEADLS